MSTALVKQAYGHVYLVRNVHNGKIYVGQTTRGVEERFRRHRSDAYRKRGPFPCALLKHGPDSFRVTPLFSVTDQVELNTLEILYIALREATNPRVGYNLLGGGGSGQPSDVARENMCKAQKLRFRTEVASDVTRKKRSEATKRWLASRPHPMLGKRLSADSIERMKAKKLGRKNPKNAIRARARLMSLTPEQRKARAIKAANIRWGRA